MDMNKTIDLEMERYRYKYDENYRPIRTIRYYYNVWTIAFLAKITEFYKHCSSFPKKKQITKKKEKVDAEAVKNYFRDYCEGTSLHGLRYVGAENVSLFER